jgi:hypothetical protein
MIQAKNTKQAQMNADATQIAADKPLIARPG